MIYVIGIPLELAEEQLLMSSVYFGQYGCVEKVTINFDKSRSHNKLLHCSASAYLTFQLEAEASLALLAVQNWQLRENQLKVNFGMTKFCNFSLAKMNCKNIDCAFFHGTPDPRDVVQRVGLAER